MTQHHAHHTYLGECLASSPRPPHLLGGVSCFITTPTPLTWGSVLLHHLAHPTYLGECLASSPRPPHLLGGVSCFITTSSPLMYLGECLALSPHPPHSCTWGSALLYHHTLPTHVLGGVSCFITTPHSCTWGSVLLYHHTPLMYLGECLALSPHPTHVLGECLCASSFTRHWCVCSCDLMSLSLAHTGCCTLGQGRSRGCLRLQSEWQVVPPLPQGPAPLDLHLSTPAHHHHTLVAGLD